MLAIDLDDAITPSTDDLLRQAIEEADDRGCQALLVILDTPGGGLQETMEILRLIEETELPVIAYVYPQGSTAWSAGTMILISSDLAAMAPHTIIGSAQPVRLSPTGGTEPINDTKTTNAIVALIEEKARRHGRNATAAREFVLSNLNLNAEEALSFGVIEQVSPDPEALLAAIDGLTVKNRTLDTAGAKIVYFEPPIRLWLLQLLSDPMISGLLMLIGLYALIFGISNPGIGAEVFGLLCLALGLIGTGFDVNIGAVFLILLGMGLIVAELHSHSFGLLGLAGLICIVAGSILFAPVGYPQWYYPGSYQRSMAVTFVVPSLIMGIFFALAIYKVAQARLRKPFDAGPAGEEAEALDRIDPRGHVLYNGEYWAAEAVEIVEAGERVVIVAKEGSLLKVRKR